MSLPKADIPIETLIQQLHSEDWLTRCDAARLLGQSRDPRAVDALLPDLNASDWPVRRNAAQALGALRDKRAVESLIQALKDRTMMVRQRSANSENLEIKGQFLALSINCKLTIL